MGEHRRGENQLRPIVPYFRVGKEEQLDRMVDRLDEAYLKGNLTDEEYAKLRTNLAAIIEDEYRRCKERVAKMHE